MGIQKIELGMIVTGGGRVYDTVSQRVTFILLR